MEVEREKRYRIEDTDELAKPKLPRLDPSKFYQGASKIPTSQELDWRKKLLRIRKPLPKM